MASVQSSIRAKVERGEFPEPKGAETFLAYVIAGGNGLIPEMEIAARQTLDHPMSFEVLGEGLQLFGGSALRELANFRKRCRDNLIVCSRLVPQCPTSRAFEYLDWSSRGYQATSTNFGSPHMVNRASLAESERLERSKLHPSTRYSFKNTWGILDGPPESCAL
jgi:hypothetical protein